LAGDAHAIFAKEDPLEKRRLLNFVRTARGAAESFAPPSANRLIYMPKRPPLRRRPIQFTDKFARSSGLAGLPRHISNSVPRAKRRSARGLPYFWLRRLRGAQTAKHIGTFQDRTQTVVIAVGRECRTRQNP
jgi:hypothetical protein